jgi:hypothetical protein
LMTMPPQDFDKSSARKAMHLDPLLALRYE